MDQISERIYSPNHDIHSFHRISKIIVNLDINKGQKQGRFFSPNITSTEFITNKYC